MSTSNDLTSLLRHAAAGDRQAREDALRSVYGRLHELAEAQLAGNALRKTLQPTALIHEVYVRLFRESSEGWGSRGQFLAIAARAMRQICVDHARRRGAEKRGGSWQRLSVEPIPEEMPVDAAELIDLDAALDGLEAISPRQAAIVELRFFGGLTVAECSRILGIADRTTEVEWRAARAWLRAAMAGEATS